MAGFGPRLPNRDVSYITVSIGGIADSRGCRQVADFTSEPWRAQNEEISATP